VVHRSAFPPPQAVHHEPPPADVLSGDLVVATPLLGVCDVDDTATMAVGAAV